MTKRKALWALLLLVPLALRAGQKAFAPQPGPALPKFLPPLPTEKTLPLGLNSDCLCVVENDCEMTEAGPAGHFEVRGLSCRWSADGFPHATCSFESRFVYDRANAIPPDTWKQWAKRFRYSERRRRWCEPWARIDGSIKRPPARGRSSPGSQS